jgi:hypothetical protein
LGRCAASKGEVARGVAERVGAVLNHNVNGYQRNVYIVLPEVGRRKSIWSIDQLQLKFAKGEGNGKRYEL